jgi:hypothetical protein
VRSTMGRWTRWLRCTGRGRRECSCRARSRPGRNRPGRGEDRAHLRRRSHPGPTPSPGWSSVIARHRLQLRAGPRMSGEVWGPPAGNASQASPSRPVARRPSGAAPSGRILHTIAV